MSRLVGGGVPAAQLARGDRDGLEAGLVAVGGVLADQRQQHLQVLGDVVLHQEGLSIRHAVLLQLHDVVRTIVRRADLQILRAHLGLHLRAEMGEQHVAREVGLELGLRVALGHGELEAAGGAHQHPPHHGRARRPGAQARGWAEAGARGLQQVREDGLLARQPRGRHHPRHARSRWGVEPVTSRRPNPRSTHPHQLARAGVPYLLRPCWPHHGSRGPHRRSRGPLHHPWHHPRPRQHLASVTRSHHHRAVRAWHHHSHLRPPATKHWRPLVLHHHGRSLQPRGRGRRGRAQQLGHWPQ